MPLTLVIWLAIKVRTASNIIWMLSFKELKLTSTLVMINWTSKEICLIALIRSAFDLESIKEICFNIDFSSWLTCLCLGRNTASCFRTPEGCNCPWLQGFNTYWDGEQAGNDSFLLLKISFSGKGAYSEERIFIEIGLNWVLETLCLAEVRATAGYTEGVEESVLLKESNIKIWVNTANTSKREEIKTIGG